MPQLTSTEILLIIGAIGVVGVNMITAWRTGSKLDTISQDAKVVLGHVNSKETKYVEQLVSKDREIEILKQVIEDKDRISALLAQSAVRSSGRVVEAVNDSTSPLPEIQKNTKETVETLKEIKEINEK